MHSPDLNLPWFIDYRWILGIFIAALASFHILFVRLFPLSSLRWKQVDYVWLPMAFVGIIGSVGINRIVISENLLALANARMSGALSQVRDATEFGTSTAICRTFIRSPASPPPDEFSKLQQGFDVQCDWFRGLANALNTNKIDSAKSINIAEFAGPQPSVGEPLAYSHLSQSVARYNEAVEDIQQLKGAKQSSNFESVIRFLGPALVALALALRITKVTGEIRVDLGRR